MEEASSDVVCWCHITRKMGFVKGCPMFGPLHLLQVLTRSKQFALQPWTPDSSCFASTGRTPKVHCIMGIYITVQNLLVHGDPKSGQQRKATLDCSKQNGP